jgi:hypothetical protein
MTRSLTILFDTPSPSAIGIGTPYFYHFYLQALRRAGRHHQSLQAIRRAYGEMLQAGATTWWEHLTGHSSLSHGWGVAPNFDLSAHVLGVQPLRPGFAAFRVEPHPGDLKWAAGVVPTVHGDVETEWARDDVSFELSVKVPMAAEVELSVPAVSLNGSELIGRAESTRREFHGGRARYWVTGPGVFRVRSALPSSGAMPAAEPRPSRDPEATHERKNGT